VDSGDLWVRPKPNKQAVTVVFADRYRGLSTDRWGCRRLDAQYRSTPSAMGIKSQLPRPNRPRRFEDGACMTSSGGGVHARLDLFAGRSDQQRQFNCRCSHALTRVGTERHMASRSRSSSPTLGPVDCGPFHPRNHRAWTLGSLLWPPSQGYFCPCGTIPQLAVHRNKRLLSKRTRFLPSLLTRVARSLRKGHPRYRLGESPRPPAIL
jgi:hypothetical protein